MVIAGNRDDTLGQIPTTETGYDMLNLTVECMTMGCVCACVCMCGCVLSVLVLALKCVAVEEDSNGKEDHLSLLPHHYDVLQFNGL